MFETKERKTNSGVCGTIRQELAADQALLRNTDEDRAMKGLLYSVSDGIYFKQMMETPSGDASFVMGIQNQSAWLPDFQRQSAIKGRNEHMIYRLAIGFRNKG